MALALSDCESTAHYTQRRTQTLLAQYPPGTSRSDVEKKFKGLRPVVSETRPAAGWDALQKYPSVAGRIKATEQRTGKAVSRCDCYSAPDGWLSLCYVWFYYDANDGLADAEWQYQSD